MVTLMFLFGSLLSPRYGGFLWVVSVYPTGAVVFLSFGLKVRFFDGLM